MCHGCPDCGPCDGWSVGRRIRRADGSCYNTGHEPVPAAVALDPLDHGPVRGHGPVVVSAPRCRAGGPPARHERRRRPHGADTGARHGPGGARRRRLHTGARDRPPRAAGRPPHRDEAVDRRHRQRQHRRRVPLRTGQPARGGGRLRRGPAQPRRARGVAARGAVSAAAAATARSAAGGHLGAEPAEHRAGDAARHHVDPPGRRRSQRGAAEGGRARPSRQLSRAAAGDHAFARDRDLSPRGAARRTRPRRSRHRGGVPGAAASRRAAEPLLAVVGRHRPRCRALVAGQARTGPAAADPRPADRQPVRSSAHGVGTDPARPHRAGWRPARRRGPLVRGGHLRRRRLRRCAGARGGVPPGRGGPSGGGHPGSAVHDSRRGRVVAVHAARAAGDAPGSRGGGVGRGGRRSGGGRAARRDRRPPAAGRSGQGLGGDPAGLRAGGGALRRRRHRRRRSRDRAGRDARPAAHADAVPVVAAGRDGAGRVRWRLRPPGRPHVRQAARRPVAARDFHRPARVARAARHAAAGGVRDLDRCRLATGQRRGAPCGRVGHAQPLARRPAAGRPPHRRGAAVGGRPGAAPPRRGRPAGGHAGPPPPSRRHARRTDEDPHAPHRRAARRGRWAATAGRRRRTMAASSRRSRGVARVPAAGRTLAGVRRRHRGQPRGAVRRHAPPHARSGDPSPARAATADPVVLLVRGRPPGGARVARPCGDLAGAAAGGGRQGDRRAGQGVVPVRSRRPGADRPPLVG